MRIEAKYHGNCGACGEHIGPGDRVAYEHDALVHAACDERWSPDVPVKVCPTCWLAKPCGCEDTL